MLAGVPLSAARAGPVLDRVRAEKTMHCGGVERPGLAEQGEDGAITGLLVDLCRAVGVAAVGPDVRVVFDLFDADATFEAVRAGREDVAFLTGAEIVDHRLAGALVPGPPVFFETSALLVMPGLKAATPADLAGEPICFGQDGPTQIRLEAWYSQRHLSFIRMGYQEPSEMNDAFDAKKCHAVAGEITELAAIRRDGGPTRRGGRLLPEAIATQPILATTGMADAGWSAVVAWSIAVLQDADRPTRPWAAGGADALPIDAQATALGLRPGWQAGMLRAVGTYGTLLRRDLGEGSDLKIEPGPSALVEQGGLLAPPAAD